MSRVQPRAASELLRGDVASIVSRWRASWAADPAGSGELSPARAEAVVAALADALERAPRPAALGRVALDLAEAATGLEAAIRQLRCLREVLHAHLVERLAASVAVDAQHRLNAAVDTMVEACACTMARRLEDAAFLDPLTGLLNRRAMERDLSRELADAARHGRALSLIMGDLDRLKDLNDQEGHAAGDRALRSLGEALEAGLRAGDSAYRIGGDEFLVLLPETAAHDVPAIIQRVLASGPPAFSWGAATYPEDGGDAAVLLEAADRRLFTSRRTARGDRVPAAPAVGPARARPSSGRRLAAPPLLVGTFFAGALLGGASLATAATGSLPDPAQTVAHTILARVGLHVPGPAGDRRPAGPSPAGSTGRPDIRAVRATGGGSEGCPGGAGPTSPGPGEPDRAEGSDAGPAVVADPGCGERPGNPDNPGSGPRDPGGERGPAPGAAGRSDDGAGPGAGVPGRPAGGGQRPPTGGVRPDPERPQERPAHKATDPQAPVAPAEPEPAVSPAPSGEEPPPPEDEEAGKGGGRPGRPGRGNGRDHGKRSRSTTTTTSAPPDAPPEPPPG